MKLLLCSHFFFCIIGLNVYSMLKHKTLVLTLDAVNLLEQRLLHYLYSYSTPKLTKNPTDHEYPARSRSLPSRKALQDSETEV